MTNLALADFNRLWVGFDHLQRQMMRVHQQPDYPRYNIIKNWVDGDEGYIIEMDLAGWNKDQINVVHSKKDGTLTINGEKKAPRKDSNDTNYVHRGISGKAFNKEFQLAEHIEVNNAQFEDGLLRIELVLKLPEDQKPLTINIR